MKPQGPAIADNEHRVLKFRPRTSNQLPALWDGGARASADHSPESDSLARYAQKRDEPDDFRHRMLANLAALAFTAILTAIGIWLAMSIADMRNTQDCVLMGRRDCAHIVSPRS